MHLHISSNRLISEVQREFNALFPFLKLEFFNQRALVDSDFSASQLLPANKKLGDTNLSLKEGDLDISEEIKVIELEKLFKDRFSLAVQVFRKSGNLWLETTMTDNWTLQQQNTHGREISTERSITEELDDYDLGRDADH